MTTLLHAIVWLVGMSLLFFLRIVAAVSAPFCRNQPRYEDDI